MSLCVQEKEGIFVQFLFTVYTMGVLRQKYYQYPLMKTLMRLNQGPELQ